MSPRAAWRLEAMGFQDVFDYAAGEADWAAEGLPLEGTTASLPRIGSIARKDVPTAGLNETIGEVRARLPKDWDTVMVLNEQRVVLGRLFESDLGGDADRTVEAAMSPGPSTYRPNVTTAEMLEVMRKNELETAPVTTSEGKLVGLLLIEDIEKAQDSKN